MTVTISSLFCGAGGLDLGFHQAGARTLWANDNNADACATFRKWNTEATVIAGNVKAIQAAKIPDTDLILGGFPCQGFSLAGPRKIDDSRNTLYREYVRIIKEKNPKAFVGENVKGLLSMGGGKVFQAIVQDFQECGYTIHHKLVNAADYGVAQDRWRVIIVGFKDDLNVDAFKFPEPLPRTTLREALKNAAPPTSEDVCSEKYSPRYMSRQRRRDWEQVSFTIPAMAKQVPLHPSSPPMKRTSDGFVFGDGPTRRFSWQEAALIQSFPSDFQFSGNLTSKYRQIGNAVPPALAKAIASSVLPVLTRANT